MIPKSAAKMSRTDPTVDPRAFRCRACDLTTDGSSPACPLRVVSIQIGQPRTYRDAAGAWTSAIAKAPVSGPVELGAEGLVGDAQADRKHHGGPHQAVLAYAAAHYPLWARELGRELPSGGFGENVTVADGDETNVCLGDVWELGAARLEVSQPRQPCRNPARLWGIADLDQRMRETSRTGWYLRVLQTGAVAAGQPMRLVARPWPELTIAQVNRTFYFDRENNVAMGALAACPALSPEWRARFANRLAVRG